MVLLPGSQSFKQGSQQLLARSGWARLIMGKYFGVNSVGATKMRPLSTLRIAIQMPLVSLN